MDSKRFPGSGARRLRRGRRLVRPDCALARVRRLAWPLRQSDACQGHVLSAVHRYVGMGGYSAQDGRAPRLSRRCRFVFGLRAAAQRARVARHRAVRSARLQPGVLGPPACAGDPGRPLHKPVARRCGAHGGRLFFTCPLLAPGCAWLRPRPAHRVFLADPRGRSVDHPCSGDSVSGGRVLCVEGPAERIRASARCPVVCSAARAGGPGVRPRQRRGRANEWPRLRQ